MHPKLVRSVEDLGRLGYLYALLVVGLGGHTLLDLEMKNNY